MNQGLSFSYNMKLPVSELDLTKLESADLEIPFSEQELAALQTSVTKTLAMILMVLGIVLLVYALLMIASRWRIFKKAGTGGWKALIPVYSEYTLYKIAWKRKYFFVMLLFTVLFYALLEVAAYLQNFGILCLIAAILSGNALLATAIISRLRLAKAFGKGDGFAIALIVLPVIFMPVLGFGKAKYRSGKKNRKKKVLSLPDAT